MIFFYASLVCDTLCDELQNSNSAKSPQTQPICSDQSSLTSLSKELIRKQIINNVFDLQEVQKRSLKNKSPVWTKFKQVVDENKNSLNGFFCCNLCFEVIEIKSKTGTTTQLGRHICRKDKFQPYITNFALTSEQDIELNKIIVSQHHHQNLREGCIKFVCSDLRPYVAVECPGLLKLVEAAVALGQAYPRLKKEQIPDILPSRSTVKREIEIKVEIAKQMVKDKLHETFKFCGGFACTSDLWTDSHRQKTYLSITGHLNTVGESHISRERYSLCLQEIDDPVKSKEVIDHNILGVLSSYGFSSNDVKTSIKFVTDRGSQYKTTDKYQRANCWAHLLNNVVEAMCDIADVKAVISDAAALVRYVKKSGLNSRLETSLKSYCETRWSTTYTMLHSIVSKFEAINVLLEERQKQHYIECLQKSTISKIALFLEPFKIWTDFLEADKSITIHKVLPVYMKMMEHLRLSCEKDVEIISSKNFNLIENMKTMGREYIRTRKDDFTPTIDQYIAVVLHPRLKKLKKVENEKREFIYGLIDSHISGEKPAQSCTKKAKRISQSMLEDFADSDNDDILQSHSQKYCKEFEEYLRVISPNDDEFYSNDDSNALSQWWFKYRSMYPNLFKLFIKTSSIPASSAPSERQFSVTGIIINDRRSCILPKNVSNIMMCRNLYKN